MINNRSLRISAVLVGILLIVCGTQAHAAKRFWRGGTSTSWKLRANWSNVASGGTTGFSVPGASDTAYFNSAGNVSCSIDSAFNVKRWEIASSYTGTISQNNIAITVGSSNAILSGGTFTGSGSTTAVTINGSLTINGCAFTSTKGTMTISGGMTYSTGSFAHNGGTVSFTATSTISGNITFSTLEFAPTATAATFTVSNSITAKVLAKWGGNKTITVNTGNIYVKGNLSVTNNATGGGGGATVTFNAGSDTTQTLTGAGASLVGALPNVTIAKTATDTLFMTGVTNCAGNWTFTSGLVTPQTGSGLCCIGTKNLDMENAGVTMAVYNLTLSTSGTRTLTGNAIVQNNLSLNTGTTLAGSSYTISIGGTWSANGTFTIGTSTVEFTGSGYKEIKRNSGSQTFYKLKINKPNSAIKASVPVIVNSELILTSGRLRTTSANYVSLIAGASVTGGSTNAFVHGPIRKTGNTAFSFPVGDTLTGTTGLHPLSITAPSNISDQFEAQYIGTVQTNGSSKASTLESLSSCEHWKIQRISGTSSPVISLGWNGTCDNGQYSEMRVTQWNGTQWSDLGQSNVTITDTQSGYVTAQSAVSFSVNPATLTIGYAATNKSYTRVAETPEGGYINTDGNVLYFEYVEGYQDSDGIIDFEIVDISTNTSVTLYGLPGSSNLPVKYGSNFYRMDLYTSASTPLSSGMYMLIITNDKEEKFQLIFNKN